MNHTLGPTALIHLHATNHKYKRITMNIVTTTMNKMQHLRQPKNHTELSYVITVTSDKIRTSFKLINVEIND